MTSSSPDLPTLSRRDMLRWSAFVAGTALAAPGLLSAPVGRTAIRAEGVRVASAEDAAQMVHRLALEAVASDNRGVGGLIIDNRTGEVIREGRNGRFRAVAPAVATAPDQTFTWDYTQHGETSLVGWYQANRRSLRLPDPRHLTVITSLDPCAMCTGSLLTAGFTAGVVAFDPTGGMNITMDGRFPTLPLSLRPEARDSFGFYAVQYIRAYDGPAGVPLRQSEITPNSAAACANVFFDNSAGVRNVDRDVPLDAVTDPRDLTVDDPMRVALAKVSPYAFALRLADPRRPDGALLGLLRRLERRTPGARNAVAFIDPFGNLLFAYPDLPSRGSIATAFFNTTQAYARTRYRLFNDPSTHVQARNTLTGPNAGTFVWLRAPEPHAMMTVKDLGAYGSTIGRAAPGNFQYYLRPRSGTIEQLRRQISLMPPFYTEVAAIDPRQVAGY